MNTTAATDLVLAADEIVTRFLSMHRTRLGGSHVDHARRVAAGLGAAPDHEIAAALLHDVIEKSEIGVAQFRALVHDAAVVALVDILTVRDGETEHDYLRRCARDPVALRIKRLDLEDKLTTDDVHVAADVADDLRSEALGKLCVLNAFAIDARRNCPSRSHSSSGD